MTENQQRLFDMIQGIETEEGTDRQSALRDLLTDLRHVASRAGLDFDTAVFGSGVVHGQEEAMDEEQPLGIRAEIHSDDQNAEAEFDAAPWFRQATDAEIVRLAKCGFGGDYPADEVAQWVAGQPYGGDVKTVFDYITVLAKNPKNRDVSGFECHIDPDHARDWIREHRPHLVEKIGDDE